MHSDNNHPDVIVVGAGLIGLSIAFELARAGQIVTVFDRDHAPGLTSRAAGGMLAPLGESPEPGPFVDLAVESLALYANWAAVIEDESGIDVGFRPCGQLLVAHDESEAIRLQERAKWQGSHGFRAQWLTPEQLPEIEPNLSPYLQGGLHLPDDAQVDNRRLHEALLVACQRRGVTVSTGVEVSEILTAKRREREYAPQDSGGDGAAIGVRLAGGERIWTNHVVVAAGAWTPRLHGVPPWLPVRPVRGQMLLLESAAPMVRGLVAADHVYLIPRNLQGAAGTLVGASVEDAGFDTTTDPGTLDALYQAALRLVPALAQARIADQWAGLRPGTRDGLPLIGAAPQHARLILAAGHFRNGVLLAPITAQRVRELVLEPSRAVDPIDDPFHPQRFAPALR